MSGLRCCNLTKYLQTQVDISKTVGAQQLYRVKKPLVYEGHQTPKVWKVFRRGRIFLLFSYFVSWKRRGGIICSSVGGAMLCGMGGFILLYFPLYCK